MEPFHAFVHVSGVPVAVTVALMGSVYYYFICGGNWFWSREVSIKGWVSCCYRG